MVRSTIAQLLLPLLQQLKENSDFSKIAVLKGVSEAEFLADLEVLTSGKAGRTITPGTFAKAFMDNVIDELEKQHDGVLPARRAKELQQMLNTVYGGDHYLVVQSPIRLSKEQQEEISETLRKKYSAAVYPLFKVNKALIGGLRVFYNGQVQDHSWLGRINVLTSIVS